MSRLNPKHDVLSSTWLSILQGLKVYGEGEWEVKIHGTDGKRRMWRKLHLAVNADTNDIIAVELSLSHVTDTDTDTDTDTEVFPHLLKQTRKKNYQDIHKWCL